MKITIQTSTVRLDYEDEVTHPSPAKIKEVMGVMSEVALELEPMTTGDVTFGIQTSSEPSGFSDIQTDCDKQSSTKKPKS